ncbi:MAG: GNAT family N-acetyltransferase [Actinomycetia bacterium]|nr:GNAT family N-acetyltransferase [Actinomycetes bacterium]
MSSTTLLGRRILLRQLQPADFERWREVRRRNVNWLTKWEPIRALTAPDVVEDRSAFALRCHAREREWQLGTGFGFGIFIDGVFVGEINLNAVQRGPFQNAYVGYWIDEAQAGNNYVPEAVVVVAKFAFDDQKLHRIQISIVPRNIASRRVVEKLGLRAEGVAERYLEINGVWEDHIRFAMTSEEWGQRRHDLGTQWLQVPVSPPGT